MNEVSKSELKAKMFEYFRAVEKTGEPLLVKNSGVPVLLITKVGAARKASEVFANVRKKAKLASEVVNLSTEELWQTLKE